MHRVQYWQMPDGIIPAIVNSQTHHPSKKDDKLWKKKRSTIQYLWTYLFDLKNFSINSPTSLYKCWKLSFLCSRSHLRFFWSFAAATTSSRQYEWLTNELFNFGLLAQWLFSAEFSILIYKPHTERGLLPVTKSMWTTWSQGIISILTLDALEGFLPPSPFLSLTPPSIHLYHSISLPVSQQLTKFWSDSNQQSYTQRQIPFVTVGLYEFECKMYSATTSMKLLSFQEALMWIKNFQMTQFFLRTAWY